MFDWLPSRNYQYSEHKVWVTSPPFPLMYWRLFVAELKDYIQTAIPGIVNCLKKEEEDRDVRMAATEGLSRLGAHGMDYVSTFPLDVLKLVCS